VALNSGQVRRRQGQRKRQFIKERNSIHGAINLAERAVGRTRVSGLKGAEGRQLQSAIANRTAALAQSRPYLLAEAQGEYKADRALLAEDLALALQAEREERREAAEDRAEAMQEKLQAQIDKAKERTANQRQKKREVDLATREAAALIRRQALANKDPKTPKDQRGPAVPGSAAEWMDFTDALARVEGVDRRAARKAVKRLRRRVEKRTEQFRDAMPGWG
jgi:hypothetical protein